MKKGKQGALTREINRYRKDFLDAAASVASDFEYGNPTSEGNRRRLVAASHRWGVAENFERLMKGKEND